MGEHLLNPLIARIEHLHEEQNALVRDVSRLAKLLDLAVRERTAGLLGDCRMPQQKQEEECGEPLSHFI